MTIGSGAKLLGPITIGHGVEDRRELRRDPRRAAELHRRRRARPSRARRGRAARGPGRRLGAPARPGRRRGEDALRAAWPSWSGGSRRPRARRRPPRSSRCATGAARAPREADGMRCESTVTVAEPPAEVFPWLLEADKVPPLDDRARGLRAARPRPARASARGSGRSSWSAASTCASSSRSPRSSRRSRACCASRAPASRRPTSTRSRRVGGGAAVTWVISGDTTSFKAQADRADGPGEAAGEARHRPRAAARAARGRGGGRVMRVARSCSLPLLLLLLLAPAPAHAGELIDRAVAGLRVRQRLRRPRRRPDADRRPGRALRDRIVADRRRADVRRRRAARRSRDEAGGDPAAALRRDRPRRPAARART